MRRLAVAGLILVSVAAPAGAAYDDLPRYDGEGFVALYRHAVANTLPGLQYPDERPAITGNAETDDRIWARALERGYQLRPVATGPMDTVGRARMQEPAADALQMLMGEVRRAGHGFIATSAYRSPATQRDIFLSRLNGSSDRAIDAALTWWSIPGTSKHHSGYAVDFRYPNQEFAGFRESPGNAWLAEDNFARPKRHGFVPSYPDDVDSQGPNPEPWEYVWVGVDLVRCGVPQSVPALAGPAAAIGRDLGRCPGGPDAVVVPDWITD